MSGLSGEVTRLAAAPRRGKARRIEFNDDDGSGSDGPQTQVGEPGEHSKTLKVAESPPLILASLSDWPPLVHRLQAPWRVTLFLLVPRPLALPSFSRPLRRGASMHAVRPIFLYFVVVVVAFFFFFFPFFFVFFLSRSPFSSFLLACQPYTGIRVDTVADRHMAKS